MDTVAHILFGKTRQAVLAALFTLMGERIYLRALARRTGIGPGPLQRELSLLTSADLVTRSNDGNRVVYQANTAHPAFHELRGLVLKTCGLPQQLRAAFDPVAQDIALALVFGSIAKGESHGKSDVDLLVVGSVTLETLLDLLEPLERQLGREISVRLFEEAEFERRRAAKDRFLTGVLTGPTICLIGALDDPG